MLHFNFQTTKKSYNVISQFSNEKKIVQYYISIFKRKKNNFQIV